MSSKSVQVLNSNAEGGGSISVPWFMTAEVDQDLVKRVHSLMFQGWHQPQGRDPMAGKRTVAESWGVDLGVSRVPRISTGRAKFAPGTVKGRLGHPPRSVRSIRKKVNNRERLLATLSAVSATANPDLVKSRGHRLPDELKLPIVFDDSVISISRTADAWAFLEKLGLSEELKRASEFKDRSGSPRMRGRRRKAKVGPLFVVSPSPLVKAARNIQGVGVVGPNELSIKELAPNGTPGRLVLWSQAALEVVERRLNKVGEKARVAVP